MDISNLTVCKHDVIIISDTETQSIEVDLKKKHKRKRKKDWDPDEQVANITVNRIVPFCYRKKCKDCHYYHKYTSKNTKYPKQKYQKRAEFPVEIKHKKRRTTNQKVPFKRDKNDNVDIVLTRDLHSPISIVSSNDMYENISSCSFDSDEVEDLIKLTRKRMKNDRENFNSCLIRKSINVTTTEDDYQNISSNDELFDGSIHSMDTVVLYQDDTILPHP